MSGLANAKGIDVVTFGCRLNTYESEVMRREAESAGLGALKGGAIIFNTCAVTSEAVRQAKQSIRKARRENPQARIIVTGCAAQTEPQNFAAMDEVDLVLGNEEKLKANSYRALPDFGVNDTEKARVNDIFSVRETAGHMVDAIEGRARAFGPSHSTHPSPSCRSSIGRSFSTRSTSSGRSLKFTRSC